MQRRSVPALLLALGLVVTPNVAWATDGHFLHGVGAINSAMGGVGVAAPKSLLGTFYLNPAGLMAFDGTRVEFSFELFKPARTVSSDIPGFASGATESKSEFVPIPAMAWSTKFHDDQVVVGLGGLGIGGFGVDYPASMTNPILAPQPNGFGEVYSNYSLLKFTPAVAFAPTEALWLGVSGNVDWASLAVNPMPIGAPDFDPVTGTAFYRDARAVDGAFGFGFQAGIMFQPNDMIALGASYASEQWFEDFSFNTVHANPNLANFGTPATIEFKLNVPAMAAAGIALRPLPNLTLAGDLRYMFYESTEGFQIPDGASVFNADGSVNGFGWSNIYSIHAGLEFWPAEQVALRGGYNYSQNPVPDSLAMVNLPAPGMVQHHVTVGAGFNISRRLQVSLAYYRAFENDGTGPIMNPAVPPGSTVTNSLKEDSFLLGFSFATRGGF
jgi:long-chain fatty acid transport protein